MKNDQFPLLNRIALALAGAILLVGAAPARIDRQPLVIAHRGGALLLPENSFPAFDNAVRMGADLLEFDMMMTADDQVIITHDGTINASFCVADPGSGVVAGPVRGLTLAQLLRFDCGSKPRGIYPTQIAVPGTRMPTLDALLARYRGTTAQFFGEIKMPEANEGAVDPVAFSQMVAAAVRRYGLEDRFILQSSDYRAIDAMHAADPRIRTCLLKPWLATKGDYLKLVRRHHAACILLRLENADAAEVKRIRRAGIIVVSEVIDKEADWRAYMTRGVDALFTNDPAALIAFLARDAERR